MKKRALFILFICLSLLLALASTAQAKKQPPQIKHVMLVVMDQMHPDYAKKFNMTNVLWLEHHGAWFPNAYVGDMASETVVSHNVMVSGLFPKHMGWSDEAFRDTTGVLDSNYNTTAGGMYVTGDLGYKDFQALIAAGNYPKLGTYLQSAFPGTTVAFVGEKSYQVRSMTAGNDANDANIIGVYLSGTKGNASDPLYVELNGKYRVPAGINVPSYLSSDSRFAINSDSSNDYGTLTTPPAWIYPEDGNRMVPGLDNRHLGGDTWVADAAIKIMDNENWSGLFLNFGGIDKIGHMWGGGDVDTKTYAGAVNQVHLRFIAQNADAQLGKLIAELKKLNEFKDTLIVVLADHGSTYGKHFYGTNQQNAGDFNWYYGDSVNDGNYYNDPTNPLKPPAAIMPLVDTGNVAFSYQSTAIETWLKDNSADKKAAAAKIMRMLPGVIATYIKSADGNSYELDSAHTNTKMTASERAWWKKHGQELVNTMAWSGSADVVGLMADKTTYGAYGDHGGAQKEVQRIPLVFYNPSLVPAANGKAARLVDVMPTILKTMGIAIKPGHPMDGHAYTLKMKK
jgi:arylsulfatase A-like enzyme